MMRYGIGAALALTLAACGGGGGGSTAAADGSATQSGDGKAPVRSAALSDPAIAGWNAKDACALVPKDEAAKLLRGEVKRAELYDENEADPVMSSCAIVMKDGREFRISAYKSANGADAKARKLQRDFAAVATGGPVDVAGVGDEAFWSAQSRDLWVFFDSARSVEVKVDGKSLPSDEMMKADAVALARKAGGA